MAENREGQQQAVQSQNTGSIEYVSALTQSIYELAEYRQGNTEVKQGDIVEGIPFERLKGFLANANFAPADDVAREADAQRKADRAARINGVAVRAESAPEVANKPISEMNRSELEAFASRVGVETKSKNMESIRQEILASEQPGDDSPEQVEGQQDQGEAPEGQQNERENAEGGNE